MIGGDSAGDNPSRDGCPPTAWLELAAAGSVQRGMFDVDTLLGGHGLLALFVSAFTSATLLPGSSEVLLGAMVAHGQWSVGALIAWATLGNTLGSMTTFAVGAWARRHRRAEDFTRRGDRAALAWLRRHGQWALLLAWIPIVGDALCLVGGWLRLPPLRACVLIGLGKLGRYGVIALLASQVG